MKLVGAEASQEPERPTLTVVAKPPASITRIYEDSTLYPMEEKRAESDRVIAYLMATGQLTQGMLNRTKRLWRAAGRKDALWRVLLRSDELPEDTVYEAAASVYSFSPVNVSLLETVGLIDHLSKVWPQTVISRLVGLGILPVIPAEKPSKKALTFAAYDPTRSEVRRMVETAASGPYSLHYLSRSGIEACTKAVSDFLPGVLPTGLRRISATDSDDAPTIRKAA
ncbi:MAG: hypothetical protein HKN29_13780 [Rhodothermales bacterium]|nr:hypothetical protein [Rhodothermales bacterium]